jgi:DNA-binding beta-propeller fold protein YncE
MIRLPSSASVFVFAALLSAALAEPVRPPAKPEAVGRVAPNRYIIPTNQILTPVGKQVEFPKMRPQALALSPDGSLLIATGKTSELVILEAATGKVLQKVSLPPKKKDKAEKEKEEKEKTEKAKEEDELKKAETQLDKDTGSRLSLTGLVFSPDGSRIYLSNSDGDLKVFAVDAKRNVIALPSLPVPEAKAPKRKPEIPAGLAVSGDGKRLYVAGNLSNKLLELDAADGKLLREWPCGVAPFDVVLVGNKAYVSNLGGRRPGKEDVAAPAGRGTNVRVDKVRNIASEGSVSVIDLTANKVLTEIVTGLHASALAVAPSAKFVVVANSGSDTLEVIDTKSDQIVEKIWARQTPADLFGAQPNALAFDAEGKRLFVCNGTQNAVAMVKFDPDDKESKLLGLIPVGWFPGAVVYDAARKTICVANIKGIGAAKIFKPGEKVKLQTKDHYGTLSLVPRPSETELEKMTQVALLNMQHARMVEAGLSARPNQPVRPVPERVGEPSVFKHVIYVIKENRSYDQVLGDIKTGNGDLELCTFGEKFTPNQHKIAREFALLDNTYCSGVQSADGHQWTDSAIANEYIERQLTAAYPRSYPGAKGEDAVDALAWASSGFIWDNVIAHGKTFRNHGEWMLSESGWIDKSRKDKPAWLDYLGDFQAGTGLLRIACKPGIQNLGKHSKLDTVGWDLNIPDIVRAAEFIKDLKKFEAEGNFPNLSLLFLPNDHTGGTKAKTPKPATHVADNDLAFGRVVEAVSHSKFWPETCIIAIEDDPQAGWDHVSGYRTTCYVVSPYTKRKTTVSTQYNQTSVMRTIELILGLPPMNQLDATATPMSDCFMATPDLTPFTSVPNQVPLDELNPEKKKITDAALLEDAIASESLPLDEPDKCEEDVLNRILWRAMKGSEVPFPEWAVANVEDDD